LSILGFYLILNLYRIEVYSGIGLDRLTVLDCLTCSHLDYIYFKSYINLTIVYHIYGGQRHSVINLCDRHLGDLDISCVLFDISSKCLLVCLMVFNATFNNNSVIS
jgi:hypothetical protein